MRATATAHAAAAITRVRVMTDPKSRLGLAAMALGLAAAVIAVAALLGRGGQPAVGADVLVNPAGLITVNNSPTVVRHPQEPGHLVVAHRIDRPGFSALLEWSDDGGATWQPSTLPLPAGTEPCAASPEQEPCPFGPDVAFGPDGTLYALYVSLQGRGNSPGALWLATSADGGRTLEPPVRVADELAFQPRLAVDSEGTVHAVWLQAQVVALNQIVGPARIVAVRSQDGGRSFSEPVPVSDAGRERVGAASPVLDSEGSLVVLYQDFKDNRRDFSGLEGPVAEKPFALVVTRSEDAGASFGQGVELESGVVPAKRFLVFLPEYPSIAPGPDRSLYVSWADNRNGDEDVFLRRSPDGGASWSEPVRVNDNTAGDGTTQSLPRVAVAPGGRVDVLFYDRRADPADVQTEVFLASSDDQGSSFGNHRVSSEPFDSRVGPTFGSDYGTDFGTRLGLTSDDNGAFAVWTDTRLGDQNTGRQDVFAAAVTLGGSGGLRLGLALLVPGLLLVGAAVLWSQRGRTPTARTANGTRS